jgi:hypothetical protein
MQIFGMGIAMEIKTMELKPPVIVRGKFDDGSGEWDEVLINGKRIGVIEFDDEKPDIAYATLFFFGMEMDIAKEREFLRKDDAVEYIATSFAVFLSQFFL